MEVDILKNLLASGSFGSRPEQTNHTNSIVCKVEPRKLGHLANDK